MASPQIQSIPELVSARHQRSSQKDSKNSLKLVTDSHRTVKGATNKKKKLRKTRLTLRKKQSAANNESSASGNEMVAAPTQRRKKTKRRSKQQSYESAVESLAAAGREYGNNVSKRNVSKVSERLQATSKLSHSVSTKGAVSREYGDFFSCKTGLTYLETHRFDQIQSKGIKRFTDEYLKKLEKCEAFESGHNVQPFASIRRQLLNGVEKGDMSRVRESWRSERLSDVQNNDEEGDKNVEAAGPSITETTNISTAALKTIGLIQKFKNGESIEADLQASKRNESSLADTTKASKNSVVRAVTNRNHNIPNTNDEIVVKIDSNENASKAAGGKKTIPAKSSTTETFDSRIKKSLEKVDAPPDPRKKIMERLPSIEESPFERTIDLSLGQKPTDESLELPKHEGNPSGKLLSSADGYVLMKKVLTSSENTLTIVDGKKWYDSKNRSVESHYAGKMPISRTSSVDKNKNVSKETYQTTKGH